MAYYETDLPTMVSGGNGNCNNTDGFGGWWGIIALVAVAAIFGGGWGFGGFGGNGANGALTRGDLCQDMNFNNLENSVRGVQQGLCDGFYAMNTSLLTGFGNTQTAIMQNGYETRNAINSLSAQLASCCCDLSRGQERISCDIERSSNAIIQSGNANTQRILDFLCNEKISALQNENALLTSQLSQNSQTQTLLNAINRTPSPAFVVPNPYTGAYGGYGYGYGNSGCGCGCGCNN